MEKKLPFKLCAELTDGDLKVTCAGSHKAMLYGFASICQALTASFGIPRHVLEVTVRASEVLGRDEKAPTVVNLSSLSPKVMDVLAANPGMSMEDALTATIKGGVDHE